MALPISSSESTLLNAIGALSKCIRKNQASVDASIQKLNTLVDTAVTPALQEIQKLRTRIDLLEKTIEARNTAANAQFRNVVVRIKNIEEILVGIQTKLSEPERKQNVLPMPYPPGWEEWVHQCSEMDRFLQQLDGEILPQYLTSHNDRLTALEIRIDALEKENEVLRQVNLRYFDLFQQYLPPPHSLLPATERYS